MAIITPNIRLIAWNDLNDLYDHSQLSNNFIKIDEHDHTIENGGVKISNAALVSTDDDPLNEAVDTNVIRDSAITTIKIADLSITTPKILDSAISTAKIATGAITNDKIGPNAITTTQIATGAVTSNQIADETIVANDLASSSVTEAKIASGAVTENKLGDQAVTSAKIANGTIVNADIADTTITDAKLATITSSGKVANSATTATDANTANKIVLRDGAGSFAANVITANTFSGTLSGSAPAGSLSGNTLSSGVTLSSLTTLGTQAENLDMGSAYKIVNLQDPTSDQDGATKKFVETSVANLSANQKTSCKAATPGTTETYLVDATTKSVTHIKNLSGGTSPALDGHTLAVNDRILIKDAPGSSSGTGSAASPSSSEIPNGIYTVKSPLGNGQVEVQRATDMDADAEVLGARTFVEAGTINAGTTWNVSKYTAGSNPPAISGTIYWVKVGSITAYTGSNGITVSGQDISLSSSIDGAGLTLTSGVLNVDASQPGITSAANLATVGTITSGTWQGGTIAANYLPIASTTNRGTASFSTDSFAVDGSGVVTIKSAGVTNTQLVNKSITIGSSSVDLGASLTTITGLTSVTANAFVGPLTGAVTGNASTATTLQNARTINGVSFDGSANINVPTQYALTAGTGLTAAGTFDGSTARTIAIDNTVATLTGTQALENKTVKLQPNSTTVPAIRFTATGAALLTTQLAGALEVDSTGDLYYTPTASNRSKVLLDSNNSIANAKLVNSSVKIGETTIALGETKGTLSNPLSNVYFSGNVINDKTIVFGAINGTPNTGPTFEGLTASGFVKTDASQRLTTVSTISGGDFNATNEKKFFATPNNSSGTPDFRLITVEDLPSLSSADLRGKVSDETGSGGLVFATSPTISSPTINSGIIANGTVRFNSLAAPANTTKLIKVDADGILTTTNVTVTRSDLTPGKSANSITNSGLYVLPPTLDYLPINADVTAGDEIYYQTNISGADSVIWHLRFNGTNWDFLGGGGVYKIIGADTVAGGNTINSSSEYGKWYNAWSSSTLMTIDIPLAGVYDIHFEATAKNLSSGSAIFKTALAAGAFTNGSTDTEPGSGTYGYMAASGTDSYVTTSSRARVTLPGNTTSGNRKVRLVAGFRDKSSGSATCVIGEQEIHVVPARGITNWT